MQFTSLAQSADEAALCQLAERFFDAYQNRDLNTLLLLWSEKSPDLKTRKETFQQLFAANRMELKSLTIRSVSLDNGKATVRAATNLIVVNAKTAEPVVGSGNVNRTLRFVREGELWKVWEYVPSERDLAEHLVSAKTDEERKALLETEKELVTGSLVQALLRLRYNPGNQKDDSRNQDLYGLADALAEQLGDERLGGDGLSSIGDAYFQQGNWTRALEYYQRNLKLQEKIGDKTRVAGMLQSIGAVYGRQGDHREQLKLYEASLKISEELHDRRAVAHQLRDIGSLHQLQGDCAQALEYYQKSLRISEEMGDTQVIGMVLADIGEVYQLQGNYAQALAYLQKGLRRLEVKGIGYRAANVAATLSDIGVVHQSQGNYEQALEYYEKTLQKPALTETIGNGLNNIATVYEAQGKYAQALDYYEQSLKAFETLGWKDSIAVELNNIGIIHKWQGDYARAHEYYQKSLRISEEMGFKRGLASVLADIAVAYRLQGKYAQAIEHAERAAVVAKAIGARESFMEARTTAGEAYRALNQPEEARRAFADAIAVVEEKRDQVVGDEQEQQKFFENRLSAYYQLIELLIEQENFSQALAYAERTKGRALLDTLRNGRTTITGAMSTDEQNQERVLANNVGSLNLQISRERQRQESNGPRDASRLPELEARLKKARLEHEAFQVGLYAAHPELRIYRGQMQPISLDQAGMLIQDKDTALLEYVVGKDTTQLFVLTKRPEVRGEQSAATPMMKVYTLKINEKDLTDRVRKFRGRLANQDFLVHEPARELYDLLLGPARAELQNKTNLIIVPDGILWELPFQALQPAPKRFLIENSAVSYTPSLTVLDEMIRARLTVAKDSLKLLALGNPAVGQQTTRTITSVLMDQRLDPLPEAERQVKELARLYGPERSKIYTGGEAQEARVKKEAGDYGILHLAAHGILNDKSPMYSQVVLSQPEGDTNEDGMLEAWEVMKLDLKADLVVLSACETARGKVGNGEGMIGLTWAFFVAGVPTTVASQWSVEAASTTELMLEFHRNLERHKGKAESLRQAMLKLLKSKEYNRPFYWAGFVVVGNGR